MDRFELRYADYSLSSDQEAVRDAFHAFFTNECPTERVRAAEPLGYDEKLWRQLADLGAASMGLPESAGGDGAALVELLLVAEEAGAALAPVPFIEHAAASRALAGAPGASAELRGGRGARAPDPGPGHGAGRAQARQLVPGGAVARSVLALAGSTLVVVHADEPPPLAPNQGSTPLAWWDLAGGRRQELARGAGRLGPLPGRAGGVEAADRGGAGRPHRARAGHRRRVRQDPRDDGRAHRIAAGRRLPARRRGHRDLRRAEPGPAGGLDAGARARRGAAPGARPRSPTRPRWQRTARPPRRTCRAAWASRSRPTPASTSCGPRAGACWRATRPRT